MKELTIKDKAKRYDEVIEELRGLLEGIHEDKCNIMEEDIIKIFPELKNSKDEKIRKSLINYVHCHGDAGDFTKKEFITWLEGLGEDKKEDSNILQRFSFYSYKDEQDILYLAGVFVNEEYRNKGIGSKILEVADEVAKSMRCNAIRLKVKKDTDAYRLYLKKGYNILTNEGNQDWLEKQGKQNEIIDRDEFVKNVLIGAAINLITWIDCNTAEGNVHLSNMECKDIKNSLVNCNWNKIYTYIKKKLEKQDEQKSSFEIKTPEESLGIDSDTYNKVVDECICGEQKHADKVEPKFKVGDWVILDKPVLITKVEDMPYNTHQYWTSDGTWFGDATKAKLWTIQDAKDGDVLVVKVREKPFIFKGLLDKFHPKSPVAYCGIDFLNEFMIPAGVSWWTNEEVEPATKEQRDLLFQKMYDAGYEWDAEKKELKKIKQTTTNNQFTPEQASVLDKHIDKFLEQKPTENKDYSAPLDIEIPFGAKDSELIQETIHIPDGCYAFIEGNEIVIKKGEKSTWSEEDEKMFNSALWHVKNSCSNGGKNSGEFEVYNWLKSLKDKVQLKVELIQLDKNILEAAIAFVELNNCFNCWRGVDKHTVLSALYSLRPQNKWKPSEEQMKALKTAKNSSFDLSFKTKNILQSLYNDLKNYYEKNTI